MINIVPDSATQTANIIAPNSATDIGVLVDFADIPELMAAGTIDVVMVPSGYVEGLYLNVHPEHAHPALQDVRVRRALALATNRRQITEDLLLGLTEPPATFWGATAPYIHPSLQPYPYDPDSAAALFDEAGWIDSNGDGTRDKNGVELVLRYITDDRELRQDVQAVVNQMWSRAGIASELVNYSSDMLWDSYESGGPMATGQYDVAEFADRPPFPDPDASYYWTCFEIPTPDYPWGSNWQYYCNEALDEIFAEQATAVDPGVRLEQYREIQEIMYDDTIWIGMWLDPDRWSVNKRLAGVRFSGAAPFWNVSEWDVVE